MYNKVEHIKAKDFASKYPTFFKKAKRNKFGAKKTVIDNMKFDSQSEGNLYAELKLQEKAGLIKSFETQNTESRRNFLKDQEKLALPTAPLADPSYPWEKHGMFFSANTATCPEQHLSPSRIDQIIRHVLTPTATRTGRLEMRAFDHGMHDAEMRLPAFRIGAA